jgi:PAS domain S-box-containing protein
MPLVESVFNDLKSARYIMFWTGTKAGDVDLSIADEHWIDAALFPITDEAGKLVNVVGQYIDITENKRDEKKLKDNERFLQTLIDAIPVPVFYKDREGKYLGFNRTFETFFGEPNEQMIGKTVFDINPPEIAKIYYAKDQELFKSGGVQRYEAQWQDVHGTLRDFIFNKAVFCDSKGSTIGLIGVLIDITERKQAEVGKEKLQLQLQQSQKMEAVGTLAGGIAHDFNNILAIILGNAELASDDVPDGNPAIENLEEIRLASIRAKDMVQQLLFFSRKADEKSKPLNMVPIIKESMKMLRSAIPTSVEFRENLSDDPCNIMGDAAQLNQIVMNLITNAVHAMSEEGLIEMTLKKVRLMEEKSCFDWILSPGDYVNLNVRDTGKGMAPETMARIFEPYYTTKEVGKGTGMGLSVIHGIIRRHNGGIRVESKLGKGTLFEVYFPLLKEKVEEEKISKGKIKKGSEKILFVDDEASIVKLNHQRLERLGYQVQSTQKPEEALRWFRADPDEFDVIITDFTMPRMTGDRLTKEILAIRPKVPVIICTGYSERMSEADAMALGACKYIEKPIENRNLAAALREVLEGK